MIQAEELILENYLKSKLCIKFMRRKDISPGLRLYIGSIALVHSERVNELSQRYKISRSFVYMLRNRLLQYGPLAFSIQGCLPEEESTELEEQIKLLRTILSYRLEGRCSITSISMLLKRQDFKISSVGYISEVLKEMGELLGNVVDLADCVKVAVVFASDEMFSTQRPLLITVDPSSSAILQIELGEDRSALSWAIHWQELIDAGLVPILITGDEGSGMKSGKDLVEGIEALPHQSDTFHAISHRLGDTCRILEKKAWASIKDEYEREAKIKSAKKERVIEERFAKWEKAIVKCQAAMALFDSYQSCYQEMLAQLQLFDKNGQVCSARRSKLYLKQAIKRLAALDQKETNKELKTIQRLVDEGLLNFQGQAQKIVYDIEQLCKTAAQRATLRMICRAYQCRKNYRKTKRSTGKKHYKQQEQQSLFQAQGAWEQSQQMDWDFDTFYRYCYQQLDRIILGSSLVETINSVVRMYLNACKNQINQPYLNLVMFYHNHRRYLQGARKGHTPMELLTGKTQQKDWLDLLMDKVIAAQLPRCLRVAYIAEQEEQIKSSSCSSYLQAS